VALQSLSVPHYTVQNTAAESDRLKKAVEMAKVELGQFKQKILDQKASAEAEILKLT